MNPVGNRRGFRGITISKIFSIKTPLTIFLL
jgi:hypothetical protein